MTGRKATGASHQLARAEQDMPRQSAIAPDQQPVVGFVGRLLQRGAERLASLGRVDFGQQFLDLGMIGHAASIKLASRREKTDRLP